MGPSMEELEMMTGTMKKRLQEGDIISTEQQNKTVVLDQENSD